MINELLKQQINIPMFKQASSLKIHKTIYVYMFKDDNNKDYLLSALNGVNN